jgi:uncharacterized membrane protein
MEFEVTLKLFVLSLVYIFSLILYVSMFIMENRDNPENYITLTGRVVITFLGLIPFVNTILAIAAARYMYCARKSEKEDSY